MSGGDNPNNPRTPPTLKRNQIYHSSEKILLIDESSTTIDDGCWAPQRYQPSSGYKNLISNRHDKKSEDKADPNAGVGNALFTDGHADSIYRQKSTLPENYDPAN